MSDAEALKLVRLIRSGNIESAVMVIRFLGVRYKARRGVEKVCYKWLKPESKEL